MILMYDTSAMLYIGDSVTRPADDFISEKLKGLPVRGLRYTLEKLITANTNSCNQVIAVMDSHTNKSELYPDYKSQRTLNRDVFVQRELLKYLLPKFGITMLMQDNFEADDLFYCYIMDLYVRNIKEPAKRYIPLDGIQLHCDDRDLLGCLVDPKICRIGLTSKTPAIYTSTYTNILSSRGYFVQYNSVLAHEMFYGKQSNNLHKIKSVDANDVYLKYLKFCVDSKMRPELISLESAMNKFLIFAKGQGLYSDDFYKEVSERMPVVYPRLTWNSDKAIIKGKLDKTVATEFLSILQEKNLAVMLGLNYKPIEQTNVNILDKWISMYRSGVVDVDNYLTSDTTFFFTDTSASGNVGGF